jgi:hypothetical protein
LCKSIIFNQVAVTRSSSVYHDPRPRPLISKTDHVAITDAKRSICLEMTLELAEAGVISSRIRRLHPKAGILRGAMCSDYPAKEFHKVSAFFAFGPSYRTILIHLETSEPYSVIFCVNIFTSPPNVIPVRPLTQGRQEISHHSHTPAMDRTDVIEVVIVN